MATQEALARVLACYDLGELKAAHRIERGFVNENWIVETTQGRYFLKRRHPHLQQPHAPATTLAVASAVIRAQHALMARLRQSGFPAPAVVPTVNGETLHVAGGECYEIQEYIAGEPYDHTRPAHLAEAAVTLGRYHACVQGFAPRALRDLEELYTPAILGTNLNGLTRAWGFAQDPDLVPVVRQLEAHAADLAARFAQHGVLPHAIIHGDYYAGNLLFEGDRIVGVVDYDKARWQARVVELAEALIYFASPRPGHLRHLVYPGFLQWEPFTCFLRHYARTIVPEDGEMHALPDYIRCIWISISLQRLWEKGARPAWACEALHEVLALGDWARANTRRMIEVGLGAVREHPPAFGQPPGETRQDCKRKEHP